MAKVDIENGGAVIIGGKDTIITAKPITIPEKQLDKFSLITFAVCLNRLDAIIAPYNDKGESSDNILLDPIDLDERLKDDKTGSEAISAMTSWIEGLFKEQGKLE